jgi:hypothetical protein
MGLFLPSLVEKDLAQTAHLETAAALPLSLGSFQLSASKTYLILALILAI